MIFLRDVLIFAGLVALAAAVITSLFPVHEGVSPVPACSDCRFKLTGEYRIVQYGNYASLYLGTREVARYGWAYVEGKPLSIDEMYSCAPEPMYVQVLGGIAYISCKGERSKIGRSSETEFLEFKLSADGNGTGCLFAVEALSNLGLSAVVEVYDDGGRLVAKGGMTLPGNFSFRALRAGVYNVRVYAPPWVDKWFVAYATVKIVNSIKTAVYTSNNTEDLRPYISLKVIDIMSVWKTGRSKAVVFVNPWGRSGGIDGFTVEDEGAFADFLLGWEDCPTCDYPYVPPRNVYVDEVWRLVFKEKPELRRIFSHGGLWHEVYADGKLIYTWKKDGPKNDVYTGSNPSISVEFKSQDGTMNARAIFVKECRWG